MLHRLFAALPVPPHIGAPLLDLQKGLAGASWRPLANFHITLRYFGEVDTPTAREIDHELGQITAAQFQLEIDGMGWFGRRAPHAVWARIRPQRDLSRLAGACERAARRLGLPPERRAYTPHITLAYLHATPLEEARAWVDGSGGYSDGPFWCDRFHVYESFATKGPTRYEPRAEYPLT
ncbi:MAG: RNA 2',3'-cyclic phosphodiesterase [Pseudomonadota bacterium]